MASYARSCYPMAMQAVREAISKDSVGHTKEAYCCYLSSILFMIQALKDEAWDKQEMKDLCHDEAFKLYKLTEQSLGRAQDILREQNTSTEESTEAVHKEKLSPSISAPTSSVTYAVPRRDQRIGSMNFSTPPPGFPSPPPAPTAAVTSLPSPPTAAAVTSLPSPPTAAAVTSLPTPPTIGRVLSTTPSFISSLPTPPGFPEIPAISTLRKHQAQNYDMNRAYQQRKSKDVVLQKYASCNHNMSLFREMAEKKKLDQEKERAYQEKMMKRQQQIKIEAERRWNQRNSRSSRDKEYRQDLLETMLSYEQDARWPLTLRDSLVISDENEDTSAIVKVVRTILTYNEHPVCKVLKEIQYEIYCSIEPLIKDFDTPCELSEDYYLVPVQSHTSPEKHTNKVRHNTLPAISQSAINYQNVVAKERKSQTLQLDTESKGGSGLVSKFKELEDDMFSSEDEDENEYDHCLLKTTGAEGDCQHERDSENALYATLDLTDEQKKEKQSDDSEIYQRLWVKGDNTENLPGEDTEMTCSQLPEVVTLLEDIGGEYEGLRRTQSYYEGLDPYQENIYEDLNEAVAGIIRNEHSARSISPLTLRRLDGEFLRTVDRIIQDILFGIDRLHSVILLAYEQLDCPIGRDASYAHLENIFFKPIWPWLIRVFRKMNVDKEDAMGEVMRTYKDCGPSKMDIREKLTLQQEQDDCEPYLEAIEEMKQVVQFTSPLEKLECTVRMSKAICHCVESYYNSKGENAPSVGCDDLLPIASYVVLKCQLPQIVSECHAMTEFIHDGYLMGEEGYCLTTLHAVISNLLSMAKPRN